MKNTTWNGSICIFLAYRKYQINPNSEQQILLIKSYGVPNNQTFVLQVEIGLVQSYIWHKCISGSSNWRKYTGTLFVFKCKWICLIATMALSVPPAPDLTASSNSNNSTTTVSVPTFCGYRKY